MAGATPNPSSESPPPAGGPSPLALATYLMRLGDDRLVLGHRLSEWCGHGPILEEDIALANLALDLIGQSTVLLRLAAEAEGQGRTEDTLAYFREAGEFRNALMVELPKGDFAFTVVRQFLFSVHSLLLWEALSASANPGLSGIAAKALKETRYHVRHTAEWMLMLGDGTEESHARAQCALDDLWRYTGELFHADDLDQLMQRAGVAPDLAALSPRWRAQVVDVVSRATLAVPADGYMQVGGRRGLHTEHLGHMLAEMQIVARSFPGASW